MEKLLVGKEGSDRQAIIKSANQLNQKLSKASPYSYVSNIPQSTQSAL